MATERTSRASAGWPGRTTKRAPGRVHDGDKRGRREDRRGCAVGAPVVAEGGGGVRDRGGEQRCAGTRTRCEQGTRDTVRDIGDRAPDMRAAVRPGPGARPETEKTTPWCAWPLQLVVEEF
jgi:hypothetical protein